MVNHEHTEIVVCVFVYISVGQRLSRLVSRPIGVDYLNAGIEFILMDYQGTNNVAFICFASCAWFCLMTAYDIN